MSALLLLLPGVELKAFFFFFLLFFLFCLNAVYKCGPGGEGRQKKGEICAITNVPSSLFQTQTVLIIQIVSLQLFTIHAIKTTTVQLKPGVFESEVLVFKLRTCVNASCDLSVVKTRLSF